MAHFKRKKTKRCVPCTMCTQHRWKGNGKGRFKPKFDWLRREEVISTTGHGTLY